MTNKAKKAIYGLLVLTIIFGVGILTHNEPQNEPELGFIIPEQATAKGVVLAASLRPQVHIHNGYQIRVQEVNVIPNGFEVYAQVFQNGRQVGFGQDGSVDIERFRFFNPPILIDDSTGTITRSVLINDVEVERKLKYDPRLVALEILVDTIRIVGKDGKNIEPGKRGRTTSTIYSTTDDGIFLSDNKSTYTLARDATSATTFSGNGNLTHNSLISTTYYVRRQVTYFDTSVVGSDTISAATWSVATLTGGSASANSDSVVLVEFTGSQPFVSGDFDLFGTTSWGQKTLASFSGTNGVYNDISMNATGIAAINKSGVTKVGTRNLNDINNSTPTGQNYMRVYDADQTGTTVDPKLVIVHAAAVGGNTKGYQLNFW